MKYRGIRRVVILVAVLAGTGTIASCQSGPSAQPNPLTPEDPTERTITTIPTAVLIREGSRGRPEVLLENIKPTPLETLRHSYPDRVPVWTQKRDGSRIRGYVVEEEIRTGPYDWVNYPAFVTLVPNGTWRANAWVMAGREAEVDPIRGVLVGSEDAELTIFSGKRPLVTLPWNPDAAEMSLALRRLNDPNFQMGPPAVTPPVLLQRE